MNIIPAHCVETRSDSLIVFSENKSKITFENPDHNTYRAIQVDGCVFTAADGSKCDNLLESEEYADQYFDNHDRYWSQIHSQGLSYSFLCVIRRHLM